MRDLFHFAMGAILGHRQRSLLSMLGIAIGIAAVVLLTSMGEGTHRFISAEFSQFGTHIIAINPGKAETFGIPGMMGGTTQKLTIDDAVALRRVQGVDRIVPIVFGQGRVEGGGRARSIMIFGVTSEMPALWKFDVGIGQFLPEGDWRRESQVCVLGAKVARELFVDQNPLGKFVRVADRRLRVIGVMAPRGAIFGQDIDDVAYVPAATALELFNRDELSEIDLEYSEAAPTARVVRDVKRILTERHGGREDYTLNTQEEMLSVMGGVMDVITMAVGAIGGISLLVGAVGILTMMWISVGERTGEIGLMKALGATSSNILRVFMAEAFVLGLLGGAFGVVLGLSSVVLIRTFVPDLPLGTPPEFVVAAFVISISTGLLAESCPRGVPQTWIRSTHCARTGDQRSRVRDLIGNGQRECGPTIWPAVAVATVAQTDGVTVPEYERVFRKVTPGFVFPRIDEEWQSGVVQVALLFMVNELGCGAPGEIHPHAIDLVRRRCHQRRAPWNGGIWIDRRLDLDIANDLSNDFDAPSARDRTRELQTPQVDCDENDENTRHLHATLHAHSQSHAEDHASDPGDVGGGGNPALVHRGGSQSGENGPQEVSKRSYPTAPQGRAAEQQPHPWVDDERHIPAVPTGVERQEEPHAVGVEQIQREVGEVPDGGGEEQ